MGAGATNYYVDSTATGTQNGSFANPWKTLSQVQSNMSLFQPGDIISFKKGYSYSGQLTISRSGTAANPITFNSYGTGAAPKFIGTGSRIISLFYMNNRSYLVFDGLEITDPTLSPTDRTIQSKIERAFVVDGSSAYITIKNCNINLVGVGAYLVGSACTFTGNTVENLRMVVNTNDGGYDDYGANPLVISSANNIVTGNTFRNCWATSYDFGYDGGAVEFFGPNTNNNFVAYNTMEDNNGLVEFGSSSGGTSTGNVFAYNKLINNGSLFYINNSGPFSITVTNLQFYNNVVVETVAQRLFESFLFSMATAISTQGYVTLENNIFWLTTGIDVARSGHFNNGQLIHNNNYFYRASTASAINFTTNPSEVVTTTGTLFKNTTGPALGWDYTPVDNAAPQVNKGKAIAGLNRDFLGNPIVNLPDMGPIELQAVIPQPPVQPQYILYNDKFERLEVKY